MSCILRQLTVKSKFDKIWCDRSDWGHVVSYASSLVSWVWLEVRSVRLRQENDQIWVRCGGEISRFWNHSTSRKYGYIWVNMGYTSSSSAEFSSKVNMTSNLKLHLQSSVIVMVTPPVCFRRASMGYVNILNILYCMCSLTKSLWHFRRLLLSSLQTHYGLFL